MFKLMQPLAQCASRPAATCLLFVNHKRVLLCTMLLTRVPPAHSCKLFSLICSATHYIICYHTPPCSQRPSLTSATACRYVYTPADVQAMVEKKRQQKGNKTGNVAAEKARLIRDRDYAQQTDDREAYAEYAT